jgi:glucose-6-phosphate dehydrogenase assembly protein OpcA
VEAWISANCHLAPGGGKLLCSEELTLQTRGRGKERVAPLLRALLVPDLPTALVWSGPPPRDLGDVLPLCEHASRVIVDSGDHASALDLFHCSPLCALAAKVRLVDLGWLRLAPVRLLLASFFDPPIGPAPLYAARRVRLDCARHGAATAVTLLGWLASRLGWGVPRRVDPIGRWRTNRPGGGEVTLEIEVRDVEAGRDGIYELLIESDGGERYAIRDAGPDSLATEATGLPERVLAAPERSDAELLVAALGLRGDDPTYGAALVRAAELSADAP